MSDSMLRKSITHLCVEFGNDPMLVQGAGGNVSWKDGDTLWIKASGTWLSDANKKDIFVPVSLNELNAALVRGIYNVTPRVVGDTKLRPSIETLLHALMPQRVVAHVHSVNALTWLVCDGAEELLSSLLPNDLRWSFVNYYKPGEALAEAVGNVLDKKGCCNIVFLKNHGVVVGADSVEDVRNIIHRLTELLAPVSSEVPFNRIIPTEEILLNGVDHYKPIDDVDIQALALDEKLFLHASKHWALYPDHVVFLGPYSPTFNTVSDLEKHISDHSNIPNIALIYGKGVYYSGEMSNAVLQQLRCYYDVLIRIPGNASLSPLTSREISSLVNWDAEKYRQSLSI